MDAPTQHEALLRITRQLQQDMSAWEADRRESHGDAVDNMPATKQKLPFVTLTYAQSIDGSIAAVRGVPTLLSGALSMKMTHMLRTMHDAILVGVGTIVADNPSLNARFAEGQNPQPVIVDTQLRCPLSIKLFTSSACEKPIILCAESASDAGTHCEDLLSSRPLWLLERKQALEAAGARVIGCRTIRDASELARVDIRHGLELLRSEAGVRSVMVEGGAAILTACLRESARSHLVDTVVVTIAPTFVRGFCVESFETFRFGRVTYGSQMAHVRVCFVNACVILSLSLSVFWKIGGLRAVDGLGNQAAAAPTVNATTNVPVHFPRLRQPQYHSLEEDLVVMGRL
ncbi:Rib7, arfc, partial [Globisporangium splendens]